MAGTATLMALKATSEARASEQRVDSDRHRAVLVLISDHLVSNGYVEAAAALDREGGAPLTRFAAADNVDLGSVRDLNLRVVMHTTRRSPCIAARTVAITSGAPPELDSL